MIWYWMILAVRNIVWFFKLPKPEDLARADRNERCPVCGWKNGRMRCVTKQKEGPTNPNVVREMGVYRQHTCNECGGRWFHEALMKGVTAAKILPCIPRTDLEKAEDRAYYLQSAPETPVAAGA